MIEIGEERGIGVVIEIERRTEIETEEKTETEIGKRIETGSEKQIEGPVVQIEVGMNAPAIGIQQDD